ncbi:MAG: hypothetical protein ACOZNI_19720 [Myxococcota bacterium]
MPAQQRKHGSSEITTSTAQAGGGPANAQKYGNAAEQERVGGDAGGGDAGLANYEAALGDFLGGELHKAVSGALTYDKFSKMANSAVDGALKALVKQAGGWEQLQADPKALDALAKILGDLADPLVEKWLEQDGKDLQEKLAKWAGAHPKTVATVALLAAVGAVIANVDLPTLKQKFSIGEGYKGEVEAELGKVRSLALQKVRAKLTDSSGALLAAVEVVEKDGVKDASLKVGAEGGNQVVADGKFDKDGLKVGGLKGVLQTDVGKLGAGISQERGKEGPITSLSLEHKDGARTLTEGFWYNSGTGVLTLGRDVVTDMGEGISTHQGWRKGSDGSSELTAGMSVKQQGLEGSASFTAREGAYGLTEEQKLKLGLKYDRESLKASLDAELSNANGINRAKVKGSATKDLGGGYSAGGSIDALLGDQNLLQVGAFYGFKDPNSFRAWLAEYRYDSKMDDSQFRGMLQDKLGPVFVRYQGQMQWGGSGRHLDLSAHGAYFFDKDTAGIAGIGLHKDLDSGSKGIRPEIGVQHKGVQVLFGYDTEKKAATVRLGIPF